MSFRRKILKIFKSGRKPHPPDIIPQPNETTKMRAVNPLTETANTLTAAPNLSNPVSTHASEPRIPLKVNPLNTTYITRLPTPCNYFFKNFLRFQNFVTLNPSEPSHPRKRTVKIGISSEGTSVFSKKMKKGADFSSTRVTRCK
jgi:hypothetical protein